MADTIYLRITDQIIIALSSKNLPPWKKTWACGQHTGCAANIVSLKNYRGINPLILSLHQQEHGFQSKWYGTFEQWKKFAGWFEDRNKEPITLERITMRDVADYRNHLQHTDRKAVATINRNIVTIRRFLQWTVDQNLVNTNVAKGVKEIWKQLLTPQSLLPEEIRRLLRETELRGDIRSLTLFTLFLYTGARVSDIVNTELNDIKITERSGSILFRCGKGNKQRTVPLPLIARQAIMKYLEVRPKSNIPNLFLGDTSIYASIFPLRRLSPMVRVYGMTLK